MRLLMSEQIIKHLPSRVPSAFCHRGVPLHRVDDGGLASLRAPAAVGNLLLSSRYNGSASDVYAAQRVLHPDAKYPDANWMGPGILQRAVRVAVAAQDPACPALELEEALAQCLYEQQLLRLEAGGLGFSHHSIVPDSDGKLHFQDQHHKAKCFMARTRDQPGTSPLRKQEPGELMLSKAHILAACDGEPGLNIVSRILETNVDSQSVVFKDVLMCIPLLRTRLRALGHTTGEHRTYYLQLN